MEKYTLPKLENALNIDSNQYSFEERNGVVIAVELFDGEYDELPELNEEIFTLLRAFPDLQTISIESEWASIGNIDELQFFKHLKSLNLACNCSLTDVSVLSRLTQLESVLIYGNNPIENLQAFAGLTKLQSLCVTGTKVSDLSPLAALSDLRFLSLSNAAIKDIKPLQSLKQLVSLDLSSNSIEDLSGLKGLSLLSVLSLQNNQITDIGALQALVKINTLYLTNNNIADAAALRYLFKLTHLDISQNKLKHIDFVEKMKQLNWLNISNNPVKNLMPLQFLPHLKSLAIGGIKEADPEPVKYCAALESLYAPACDWKTISFLKDLKKIVYLDVSNNKLSSGLPGESYPLLASANFSNNNITALGLLPFQFAIREIDLSNNPLGNRKYDRYTKEVTADRGPIADLQQISAQMMFDNGAHEEALANYYYHNPGIQALAIYVARFCATAHGNWFQLKYYFGRVLTAREAALYFGEDVTDLWQVFMQQVNTLKSYLKPHFQKILEMNARGYMFNYSEEYLQLSIAERAEKTLDPEIYFVLATPLNSVRRDRIDDAMYYFKLLRLKKSPFAFPLSNKIRNCLKTEFAYTEKERVIYQEYTKMLENIDSGEIFPDFPAGVTEVQQLIGNRDPMELPQQSSDSWLLPGLVILVAVAIAFLLAYNDFFGFAGLVIMAVLAVILIWQMFK